MVNMTERLPIEQPAGYTEGSQLTTSVSECNLKGLILLSPAVNLAFMLLSDFI